MQTNVLLLALLAWLSLTIAEPVPALTANITLSTNSTIHHLQLDSGDDSTTCSNKNEAVTNAISKLCANPVPNIQKQGTVRVLSDKDFTLGDIQWGVQILWVCDESPGKGDGMGSPAGDVSNDECFDTWWEMCALGDQYGGGITQNHGEQGCQEWSKFAV